MRILHVSEVDIGGTLIVLERLAASQLEHFGSKNVICLLPNSALSEITQIPRSCIITFTRKRRGATSLLSLLLNFSKIMFRYRPHILHIHSTFAGFVCRVFLAIVGPVIKCKVIYCPHAWSFTNKTIVQTQTFQMVERVLSRYSDLIICVSNYERSAGILAGIQPERLVVISNGVAFLDAPKPALITDNQLVEVLFVGRLSIQKGFDVLLRALRQIPPGRLHLTVIGPSIHPSGVPPGYESFRDIDYLGWTTQKVLFEQYLRADVVVMPSRWEGLPLVALEAAAHGCALLTTNIGPFLELVEDGKTGRLFPVDDYRALAQHLAGTQKVEWRRMGSLARDLVRKNYALEKTLRRTIQVYYALHRSDRSGIR